jgi:type IV pilus assembly protein PilE
VSGSNDRASGFTLVELVVVVAIVGVIAAFAIPSWGDHVIRTSASAATGLLKELRSRMEQRYADNRSYASGGATACAIPDFVDADSGFAFACTAATGGQAFTWTATGSGRGAGFVYRIDEAGMETTVSVRSGWTSASMPASRFIIKRGD